MRGERGKPKGDTLSPTISVQNVPATLLKQVDVMRERAERELLQRLLHLSVGNGDELMRAHRQQSEEWAKLVLQSTMDPTDSSAPGGAKPHPVVERRRAEERHDQEGAEAWDMEEKLTQLGIKPVEDPVLGVPCLVSNVVCSAKLSPWSVDITDWVWSLCGIRKKREPTSPVRFSSHWIGTTITVQAQTGKINLTGSRTSLAAITSCYELAAAITTVTKRVVNVTEFAVHNIQAAFRMPRGMCIDMPTLAQKITESSYLPWAINHVSFKINRPRIAVLVYPSGGVVMTGSRNAEDYTYVTKWLAPLLETCATADGTPAVRPICV